jgi:hypothetical protein
MAKANFRMYRTSSASGVRRLSGDVSLQERMEQRAKARRMNTDKATNVEPQITYEVHLVERFEIVRKERSARCGSVSMCGEFRTREDAERVADLLRTAAPRDEK